MHQSIKLTLILKFNLKKKKEILFVLKQCTRTNEYINHPCPHCHLCVCVRKRGRGGKDGRHVCDVSKGGGQSHVPNQLMLACIKDGRALAWRLETMERIVFVWVNFMGQKMASNTLGGKHIAKRRMEMFMLY